MDKIDRLRKEYKQIYGCGLHLLFGDMLDKLNELVEGYNEVMKLFRDSVKPGNHQINDDKWEGIHPAKDI